MAGCAFATSLLKAYLLPIADKCVRIYPSIKLCVYVDDIGLRQFGWDEGAVARSVAWGTKAVIKDLHEAGSVVNVDKSAFVASTSRMGSQISRALASLRNRHSRVLKNLGAGLCSRGRMTSVLQNRMRKALKRVGRHVVLREAGGNAAQLWRTGARLSSTYGLAVGGIPEADFAKSRSVAASMVCSFAPGQSTSLVLQMDSVHADPFFTLVGEPIVQWARRAWLQPELRRYMAVSFDAAWKAGQRLNGDVLSGRGPAHAVVQALLRLRWQPCNALKWKTGLRHWPEVDALGMSPIHSPGDHQCGSQRPYLVPPL